MCQSYSKPKVGRFFEKQCTSQMIWQKCDKCCDLYDLLWKRYFVDVEIHQH